MPMTFRTYGNGEDALDDLNILMMDSLNGRGDNHPLRPRLKLHFGEDLYDRWKADVIPEPVNNSNRDARFAALDAVRAHLNVRVADLGTLNGQERQLRRRKQYELYSFLHYMAYDPYFEIAIEQQFPVHSGDIYCAGKEFEHVFIPYDG
jgi:hypothetical protein